MNKLEPAPIKGFKGELSDMLRKERFYNILSTFAINDYEKRWLGLARSLTKPLNVLSATSKVQKLEALT